MFYDKVKDRYKCKMLDKGRQDITKEISDRSHHR